MCGKTFTVHETHWTTLKLLHIRTSPCACVRIRSTCSVMNTWDTIYTAGSLNDIVYYIYFSYRNVRLWFLDAGTLERMKLLFLFHFVINSALLLSPVEQLLLPPQEVSSLVRLDPSVWTHQLAQVSQYAEDNSIPSSRGGRYDALYCETILICTLVAIPLIFLALSVCCRQIGLQLICRSKN